MIYAWVQTQQVYTFVCSNMLISLKGKFDQSESCVQWDLVAPEYKA